MTNPPCKASGHRMEVIIILLIAVEVVIVRAFPPFKSEAKPDQVLIREGPELGHKLAHPMVQYIRSVIDPEAAEQTPGEVIDEEFPKMRDAVERLPHLGILPPSAHSGGTVERVV